MRSSEPIVESLSPEADATGGTGLFLRADDEDNRTWAGVLLLFMAFFVFQCSMYNGGPHGYTPFQGYRNGTTYLYRSVLSAFLFLGPLLFLARPPWRRLALAVVCPSVMVFQGAVVSTAVSYAIANDRSEALSVAIRRLLRGEFPYLPGQCAPITPLTSSFLIALPGEVFFHRPELMTMPLLVAGFLALLWHLRRIGSAFPVEFLLVIVFLNPTTIWELIWGSDAMWGGILLGISLVLLDARRLRWAALLFGLAVCTRSSLMMLAPLWGICLARQGTALRVPLLVAGATIGLLEVPMFLWNHDVFVNYAPLGISRLMLWGGGRAGDSVLGDLIRVVTPPCALRCSAVTTIVLCVSLFLGFKVRGTRQLALATASVLALMFMFLADRFLIDYFSTLLFLLLFAAISPGRVAAPK